MELSTLCYIEKDGQYLMLHRIVKKNDVNKDKWIGVGGHFEQDESPEECVLREVKEETGYTLTSFQYRGLVTFVSGDGVTEYMSLFTADGFEGEPIPCDEGVLEWVPIEKVWSLNLWEGDKIFFRLLDEGRPFFSLKLVYDGHGKLVDAILDGKPLELFDIVDEHGQKTGLIKERGVVHRDGSLHPTAHVWVVRERQTEAGKVKQLLLQKRCVTKDSYPSCFDISAAGHIQTGENCLETALRELEEELGICAGAEQLQFIGNLCNYKEDVFHGFPFRDYEYSYIYVYNEPVEAQRLRLQESEVEEVAWMDFEEVLMKVRENGMPHCIQEQELLLLDRYWKKELL